MAAPYILTAGILKQDEHPWLACIFIAIFLMFSIGFSQGQMLGISPWRSIG